MTIKERVVPASDVFGQIADGRPDGPTVIGPVKFHVSLNVRSLEKSISFYRALFDRDPARQFADYAKFELADPALVLSLEPQPHAAGGALNHLGFRVASAETLIEMQRRLESAGLPTTSEEGVECCHSNQTKFWVSDPDGNHWELYVLETDADHCQTAPPARAASAARSSREPIAWQHQLGTPFPPRIPLGDGTANEVLLRGTFNQPLADDEIALILAESYRVLRAGGKIIVHGLVSNVPLRGEPPRLPGPAAAVKFVPLESAPLDALRAAGFSSIHIARFSDSPVFMHGAASLRELLVEARKHELAPFAIRQAVIYRGPALRIVDDQGYVFHRGRRAAITSEIAELLRSGPMSDSFIFLPPGEDDR